MILTTIMFYVLSFITIASAVAVISVRNPVHSVLFLILAFFNAAGLFILLGAELLAMILVIVYVGAVAVLFLFVVMMLNINIAKIQEGFLKYLPIGILVAVVLFVELFLVVNSSSATLNLTSGIKVSETVTNTEAIGMVLYTDYIYLFQLAGLILLVAMIGAIVLTNKKDKQVRRQNISDQVSRNPKETVKLVKW